MHLGVAEPRLPPGLSRDDLAIVMLLRHALLKRSEVFASFPLADGSQGDHAIPAAALARFGHGRDLQIGIALVLARDLDVGPGLPTVRGAWLAQRWIQLRSRSTPNLFDVQPRTAEQWQAYGYPPDTVYAAEYAGGILEAEAGSIGSVWVHASWYERLAQDDDRGLLALLASEVVVTILTASLDGWKDLDAPPPGSPLARIAERLGEGGAMPLPTLGDLLAHEPARLKAMLQARDGALAGLLEAR